MAKKSKVKPKSAARIKAKPKSKAANRSTPDAALGTLLGAYGKKADKLMHELLDLKVKEPAIFRKAVRKLRRTLDSTIAKLSRNKLSRNKK
jgi:hypothetical protein